MCKQHKKPTAKATLHQLNHCEAILGERERFTWRHNSVLKYIVETLKERLPSYLDLFSDMEGHTINGGSLPPHVIITQSRPDLVIIHKTEKTVWLFERTVSFETNTEAAHARKRERYPYLA